MKLLVLHLSDLHLRSGGNPVLEKFPFIATALQNEEADLVGVVTVISGDIAYSGDKDEYAIALQCLQKLNVALMEKTGVTDVRFVFVPGNHDCNFKKDGGSRETIISAIRKGISAPIDNGMIALCADVQTEFFDFVEKVSTVAPSRFENRAYWEHVWQKDDVTVLFRCFNTAWLSQLHEQQGGLFYPETYIADAEPRTKSDYCVAVFHHPYNWFPAATYRQFRTHIEKTADLILTGHEHEPDHYQKYTFRGEVTEYLEGAVLQESNHPERSGFHAVFIDLAAQKQRVASFSWNGELFVRSDETQGWVVVQHFYLFPTRETTKQKVCELLDIPIRNLRGLDVQSKSQKLAPAKT